MDGSGLHSWSDSLQTNNGARKVCLRDKTQVIVDEHMKKFCHKCTETFLLSVSGGEDCVCLGSLTSGVLLCGNTVTL